MSSGRRVNDRRRRVLYTAHQAEQHPPTAASRNEMRRLREARRPQEAYGSRVHRRLQARWFSLVPVRRRSMTAITGILTGVAIVLCVAHYASVSWPSIAYRPEVARPLRLDRPDSFGHCLMVALLTASSGVALLIYQLRRYRNDDFKGHYRLWRVVMFVMVLASINSMVGMIDWSGAILDSLFGKRVALTGSDWFRLVVSFGGAVLALRLLAEVRRCRSALAWMAAACILVMIPEAAKWNVLTVETLGRWITVTSAPLLACTALFLSLGSYLRMLYREVRQIEDGESITERIRQLQAKWLSNSGSNDADDKESGPRRGWWRKRASNERETNRYRPKLYDDEEDDQEESCDKRADSRAASSPRTPSERLDTDDTDGKPAKPKRGWFGLRSAKQEESHKTARNNAAGEATKNPAAESSKPKRRRSSLRLKPSATPSDKGNKEIKPNTAANDGADSEPKRSRGLGWFRRKKPDETNVSDSPESQSQRSKPAASRPAESNQHDHIDTDDIDWDSLSKAERRRLRKQLKRQNRAA